jgi:crooked neck
MPAPVQITAEQLLREAKERELELVPPVYIFFSSIE